MKKNDLNILSCALDFMGIPYRVVKGKVMDENKKKEVEIKRLDIGIEGNSILQDVTRLDMVDGYIDLFNGDVIGPVLRVIFDKKGKFVEFYVHGLDCDKEGKIVKQDDRRTIGDIYRYNNIHHTLYR